MEEEATEEEVEEVGPLAEEAMEEVEVDGRPVEEVAPEVEVALEAGKTKAPRRPSDDLHTSTTTKLPSVVIR